MWSTAMAVSLYLPEEVGQVRGGGQQEEKVLEGSGWLLPSGLPDPSLCEPGLVGNRWDGRVH